MESKILNIGCGRKKLPGAVNLDIHPEADVVFDLESCGKMGVIPGKTPNDEFGIGPIGMPFPDNHFDSIQASHTLEHIRNILPLMQELHRVCKPDGEIFIRVPYGSNSISFEDPTHVRQFFPKSFMYFGQMAYNNADYGYRGDWKLVECVVGIADEYEGCPEDELQQLLLNAWNVGQEIFATMQCIKPIRSPDGKPSQLQVKTALISLVHAQLQAAIDGSN